MPLNYKCDFCGAPRLRSDNSCQFCGQIFEENRKIKFTNIKFKNIKSSLTYKKNQFEKKISSIDTKFLNVIQDNLIYGFNDSYRRSSKSLKEIEKKRKRIYL